MSSPEIFAQENNFVTFKPAAWVTKIDFINHLVLLNNVLISVVAEEGGGKTTFSHLLQAALDNHVRTKYLNVRASFNASETLKELFETFHLKTESAPSLADFANQINERKAHVLIIIDDAHHLPKEFIRDILQELQKQATNSFLHWCFLANFNLLTTLSLAKEGYDNFLHTIELGGLSESETRTYLLKNLPNPKRIDKTMSEKRLEQFYQLTGGSISRINLLMNDFFDPNPIPVIKRKRRSQKVFLLALSTAFAAGFVYLSLPTIRPILFKKTEDPKISFVQINPEKPIPSEVVDKKIMVQLEKKEVKPKVLPKKLLQREGEPRLSSYIPAWTVASLHQGLIPPPLKKVIEINFDEEDSLGDMVLMDKVVVIPKTMTKVEEVTETQSPQDIAQYEVPVSRLIAIQPFASQKQTETIVNDKSQFTIQILSSPNLPDIKRYVAKHNEAKIAKIYQTINQNKPWYVLTIGAYTQRREAQLAIAKLPGELTKQKPWVRSLTTLKALS